MASLIQAANSVQSPRTAQHREIEVGVGEVGVSKVGTGEIRVGEVGSRQIGSRKIGVREIGCDQVDAGELCPVRELPSRGDRLSS